MKETVLVLAIFSVLSWLSVIIPAGFLMNECIYSWIHGTVHGFNGDEFLYGFSAFLDTLMFYFCFFFPLFFLWGCLLITAVSLTIASVITKKQLDKNTAN